ncbi:amino acid adenylation domain-containing protein [Mycobacterium heidelbergense]|uniref:amino acid adenylation domain-containing protein n=1 Tax=Mycobacterium heidelbergense TaxID=53376 RepID=UPI003CF9541C
MSATGIQCRTLLEALQRSAERNPNQIALCHGTDSVSYAELAARSFQLAHLLTAVGVRPGDRVVLDVPKSVDAVVGIYGILAAGACYVPLDPHAPGQRIEQIVRNCAPSAAMAVTSTLSRWAGSRSIELAIPAVVVSDADHIDGIDARSSRIYGRAALQTQPIGPPCRPHRDDLAYIFYTSGSTGEPKGVALTHGSAVAFTHWAAREFDLHPGDRVAAHAPLHFDLSTFDLFAAADATATTVLVPRSTTVFPWQLGTFLEASRITVCYWVPSALNALALRGGLAERDIRALRTVLFAGEVFPTPRLRLLMSLIPHARFANLYGPTETNVCTWYDVPPLPDHQTEPIPIGRPIPGVETYAVTDNGTLAAAGEIGELYVQGPTVMHGYWDDPEQTRAVLVPFGAPGMLAYRTGDLVRRSPDGHYHLLARRDHQIKTRGYRIELGEIETALHADPEVISAVAVAIPDPDITNRLAACVATCSPLDPGRLARVCSDRLPRYMRPEWFVFYDELPLTPTGKVDRHALLEDLLAHPPTHSESVRHISREVTHGE